jgi:hypothetical protein
MHVDAAGRARGRRGIGERHPQVSDIARTQSDPESTVMTLLRPVDDRPPASSRLCHTLSRECEAMLRHALDEGKRFPPKRRKGPRRRCRPRRHPGKARPRCSPN